MMRYPSPGVYREERGPPPEAGLATGVCALIGGSTAGPFETPTQLLRRDSFPATFGASTPGGFLAEAVAGFFANGGARCYVVRAELTRPDWLDRALRSLGDSDDVDLVVAPDIALAPARQARSLQRALLDHCEADGGRFAILDAPPDEGLEGTLARRDALRSRAGALYFPWIVAGGRALPPSGHIAGLYARTDEEAAFFAAPANRELVGATDLALRVASIERGQLYAAQVNDLRALPGRGIYVMGASSLAGANQGAWSSIAVCRLFITVGRWLARAMIDLPFSPNDVQLWVRVRRELSAYFWDLWRRGALRGATPEEAFYVKCDRETNGDDVRAAGLLVTEIGLAPAVPAEFIVARLVQRPGAVTALAE